MEQTGASVSAYSNEARNAYVVEHITAAVLELLRERPLQELSVSEICAKAGVGRTSFYRNFDSKEDVVARHVEQLLASWATTYAEAASGSNAALYGSLFGHLRENATLYLLLRERGLMRLLLEALLTMSGPRESDDNPWAYTKAFLAYGTFGWVEEWFARGMQESDEEMASLLSTHGMS